MQQPPEFTISYFSKIQDQSNLLYIDIGANDGITWSNTIALEKQFNWKGICIEAHPTMFRHLKQNRNCKCLEYAVSDKEGELDFLTIEGSWEANMLSGLVDNYDSRHRDRVNEEHLRYGGVSSTQKVKCKTLQQIIDEENISKIDYLSIDTEGSELPILRGIDFSKIDIDLISVEVNYEIEPIETLLTQHGFNFVTKVACDAFYSKSKLE